MPMAFAVRGFLRFFLINGNLRALGLGRQDHHGLGTRDAVYKADGADELLERRRVMRLHLEQHGMLAGYMVAFEHIVEQGDGFFEESDRARMPDQNADKCCHVLAEL